VPTEMIAGEPAGLLVARLSDLTFRANPDYEFVLLDQLPAQEQELLSALRGDRDFFGLIRPRSANGLTIKAVCQQTAELFKLLQQPGRLPSSMVGDRDSEITVSRLVCDGILQIAQSSGWSCGASACRPDKFDAAEQSGQTLAGLSLQAIQHAASLEITDSADLSSRLYRYNTLPFTAQWLRRIPDGSALEQYLQIQVGGSCRQEIDQDWRRVSLATEQDAWLAWDSCAIPAQRTDAVGYKLYLSPLPAHLREVFRASIPAFTAAGAHHFKIGSNVRGLLRPDKMVAYFRDRPALEEAASRIAKELSGCPAQGVPFTAELDSGPLISWASDPPSEANVPVWLRRQSWRQWICDRLGSALAVAKHDRSAALPPWRFALERLRLEGVDVRTWAPGSTSWHSKPAAAVVSR